MKFQSTRSQAPQLNFSEALLAGLASDGGLYVPEQFPQIDLAKELENFRSHSTLAEVGARLLAPFVKGSALEASLESICQAAFNFPIPLVPLNSETRILELFHGPTAAFKDVGARFLAEAMSRLPSSQTHTILVATSGDTGGAVAGAFFQKPGIEVIILYPKGMVSEFQETQLTAWGENIKAYRVRGSFDDCQRLVKEAFASPDWVAKNLMSANSINIGRILPQSIYYAWASLKYFSETKRRPGFVVPTGNLGNALAALWAKKIGYPVAKVILAANANRAVVNYFEKGAWQPLATLTTLANAMDVGNASNMERLQQLYPNFADLQKDVEAYSVSDLEIKTEISEVYAKNQRVLCPHTAVATFVRKKLNGADWIVVSTAHASKFCSVVEPLLGAKIDMIESLKSFVGRKGHAKEIKAELKSLAQAEGLV